MPLPLPAIEMTSDRVITGLESHSGESASASGSGGTPPPVHFKLTIIYSNRQFVIS